MTVDLEPKVLPTDDKFAGCTKNREVWITRSKELTKYNLALDGFTTVEDLSHLVNEKNWYAILPSVLYEGKVELARSRKFTDLDEATKYANELKVIYHFAKLSENNYVVRGFGEWSNI